MDKRKAKAKPVAIYREDSLLPPTRRALNESPPAPLLDKRRPRKWTIDGFFRKVSSILDNNQSTASSTESLDTCDRQRRQLKGKSSKASPRLTGYASTIPPTIEYSPAGSYRPINNNYHHLQDHQTILNNNNNNNNNEIIGDKNNKNDTNKSCLTNGTTMSHLLEAMANNGSSQQSRCSSDTGSLEGRRLGLGHQHHKRDRVKARAEAKRDQLCVGDSSMDESSNEEPNGKNGHGKRRSRASRTERYLKRMGNGTGSLGSQSAQSGQQVGGNELAEAFRPIDRVPRSDCVRDVVGIGFKPNGDAYPLIRYTDEPITNNNHKNYPSHGYQNGNNNFYARQAESVNPLVQQTLQYFSEFDRNMAAQQQKIRKTYPDHANNPQAQRRHKSQIYPATTTTTTVNGLPEAHVRSWSNVDQAPRPPSRDHRSRLLVNGAPVDRYQQMLVQQMRQQPQSYGIDRETTAPSPTVRPVAYSPNTEVRNINEGRIYGTISPGSTVAKLRSPVSPPRSPLRESINTISMGVPSSGSPTRRLPGPTSSSPPASLTRPEDRPPAERRSSRNLEEALCELEAIYNSLQLGDEELLERAERRTMEEFHYKGFTASPEVFADDPAARRKTWADSALNNHKEEPEVPDRLRDDMAYRRMHPKERPTSVDGPSSLSSISYLMTSPIPTRREPEHLDAGGRPRRKEPDVTLDDVVFRSMQYANNTLKVVEPQPPFGIPLGPITTGADSDYLHSNPGSREQRSPYLPSHEPDLVADDLAFRNLRKDAQPQQSSSRQPSPCFLSASSPTACFDWRKRRAARSLSANLYGLANGTAKPTSPLSEDLDATRNFSPLGDYCASDARRTSDPEIMREYWRDRIEEAAETTRRISRRMDEEDEGRRSRGDERLVVEDRETEQKVFSDKGSSYVSSSGSTPPPLPSSEPPSIEPFTEQEISVYKKLCQDLENLVQLTKGMDTTSPTPSSTAAVGVDERPVVSPPPVLLEAEIKSVPKKEQSIEEYIHESCAKPKDDGNVPEDTATKETKKVEEEEDKKQKQAEETEDVEEEEDDVFFGNLRLAKLSGDWKESTPNGAITKRTSLAEQQQQQSGRSEVANLAGGRHWEGEIRAPRSNERLGLVCNNASHDVSRLTAKYLCYITNHLTAQFCLLLLFLIVLLLAIVTVP